MKNPHMGRYYAWALLSRYVKTAIRKVTFTPYYTFNYIPPKTSNRFKFVEFSNWKASKVYFIQTKIEKNLMIM